MYFRKQFNLLTISSVDLAGQVFNGYDLTDYINSNTPSSAKMAVWAKSSLNPSVFCLKTGIYKYANKLGYFCCNLTSLDNLFSTGATSVLNHPYFRETDIIHLQLTHLGLFMSPFTLQRIANLRPTAWTIHDMWPITGACIQSLDCEKWTNGCHGRCPAPRVRGVSKHYSPRLLAALKHWIFTNTNAHLIVASDWMRNQCLNSSWAKNKKISKIKFGVHTNVFTASRRSPARKLLNISDNELVITFRGVDSLGDRFKGISTLVKALSIVTKHRRVTMVILQDSSSFEIFSPRNRLLRMGWLSNPYDVANALSVADVFIMPSSAESFGLMAIEAMACGTPVIASNAGALPEHVRPPLGGLIFKTGDPIDLAERIDHILDSPKLRKQISSNGRQLVEAEYSFDRYVSDHITLYKRMLDSV